MSEYTHTYYYRLMFKAFADELDFHVITGVVTEVDTASKTCVVKPDGDEPELNDVRYTVQPSKDLGIIREPKVNSQVAIGVLEAIGGSHAIIVDMQEFESLTFDAGQDTVLGAEALTEKINALVDEVNDLKNKVNANNNIFKNHQHNYSDSIGQPPVATPSITQPTISQMTDGQDATQFNKADYEYDKIKIPKK